MLRIPHKWFPNKQNEKYDDKLYRVIKRRDHQLVLQNAYDRTADLKECHVKFAKRYYEQNVNPTKISVPLYFISHSSLIGKYW